MILRFTTLLHLLLWPLMPIQTNLSMSSIGYHLRSQSGCHHHLFQCLLGSSHTVFCDFPFYGWCELGSGRPWEPCAVSAYVRTFFHRRTGTGTTMQLIDAVDLSALIPFFQVNKNHDYGPIESPLAAS